MSLNEATKRPSRSPKLKDLTNQRFGRLLVVCFAGSDGSHSLWSCKCDCGKTKTVKGQGLRIGKIVSCGCYLRDKWAGLLPGRNPTSLCVPLFSFEDADLLESKWYSTATCYPSRTKLPRPSGKGARKNEMAHRIVLARVLGRELVDGEICDHINGNTMDCRRENLRLTDRQGNSQNRLCGPYRGTTYISYSNKWQASVKHNNKNYYLGLFATREEAAKAAADKRRELGFLGS